MSKQPKKIMIITCHDVYNHGASLQSYALSKYLTDLNFDVKVIDYKPHYLSNKYKLFSIDNPKWEKSIFLSLIYLTAKLLPRLLSLQRKKTFDRFTAKYLPVTKETYFNVTDLEKLGNQADIFICGSDQIWNTLFKNGEDPAFYLTFVPKNKIKIAYAASLATEVIYKDLDQFVKKNVERLDFIGVRENSGKKILENLGVSDIHHVVDPAFLLDQIDWDKLALDVKFNDKYILIYDFENSSLIQGIAEKISNQKNLKIYAINPGKFNYTDKHFPHVGPDMFLTLIKNAEFVLSNSYHAVVFSIIYQKDFYIVERSEAINIRMLDLVEKLEIQDRVIRNVEQVNLGNSIKLNRDRLMDFIEYSKVFLKSSLGL